MSKDKGTGRRPRGGVAPVAFEALPVVAIVGRPNVGKSTLFNRLTRSREALVADQAGLTRDRQYGIARQGGRHFVVVDTGGLVTRPDALTELMTDQVTRALDESDAVLFVTDGREGLLPEDERIAETLRIRGLPLILAVNKVDGRDLTFVLPDFHRLGLADPLPVSAAHGRGIRGLTEALEALLPERAGDEDDSAGSSCSPPSSDPPRITLVGRPNVGKSTLVNRLVGQDRVVVHDAPGTTRDSVLVPLARGGKRYTLVDTAGIRRRGRVHETTEKFSIVKTLQAIETTDVVILLLDASESVTEQDLHLLGHVLASGRALVVALNKWDLADGEQRKRVATDCQRRLRFADFAKIVPLSAVSGHGIRKLMLAVDAAAAAAGARLSTPELSRLLADAVTHHPPPLARGRRIKLRYAHQGGTNPPIVVVHGTQTDALPESYRRYLVRVFRDALDLPGTPLRVELRTGENPYKDRQNTLTRRQRQRRRRLIRHARHGRH